MNNAMDQYTARWDPGEDLREELQAASRGEPDEWRRPLAYEQRRYMHHYAYEAMPDESDEGFYIRKQRELTWIRRRDADLGFMRARDLEAVLRSGATVAQKKSAVKRWRGWVDHFTLPDLEQKPPFHGSSPNTLPSVMWLHASAGWAQYQRERGGEKERTRGPRKRSDPAARALAERKRRAHHWLLTRSEKLRSPTPKLLEHASSRLKTLNLTLDQWRTENDQ